MPMDEIYTKRKSKKNEMIVKAPKGKTIEFLKQFARIYSCQMAINANYGNVGVN